MMFRRMIKLFGLTKHLALVLLMMGIVPTVAWAYVNDLRITELDPHNSRVEVTNIDGGTFMVSTDLPFYYSSLGSPLYYHSIPPGWIFQTGQSSVFSDLVNFSASRTDFWLYRDDGFDNTGSVIHGLQFGTPLSQSKTGVAVSAGIWPDATTTLPAPPPGHTLAWDGGGYAARNWYVDATPSMWSYPDVTAPGTVPSSLGLSSSSTQSFEDCSLGDQIDAIENWSMNGDGADFSARFVSDTLGQSDVRLQSVSTKWLCIKDMDDLGDNRIEGPTIEAGAQSPGYQWAFSANLEQAPPSGVTALAIQHKQGGDFIDAWGFRFSQEEVEFVVFDAGGTPAAAGLYTYKDDKDIGQWVQFTLQADWVNNQVTATVNGGSQKVFPIDLTGDQWTFRFSYDGFNGRTVMLLDDLSLNITQRNDAQAWKVYR